uniref:Uncharacterized protein n=1 Tax=Arundo donax TaxID=35708 RepID=A0A0A8YB58_ARUDO
MLYTLVQGSKPHSTPGFGVSQLPQIWPATIPIRVKSSNYAHIASHQENLNHNQ